MFNSEKMMLKWMFLVLQVQSFISNKFSPVASVAGILSAGVTVLLLTKVPDLLQRHLPALYRLLRARYGFDALMARDRQYQSRAWRLARPLGRVAPVTNAEEDRRH